MQENAHDTKEFFFRKVVKDFDSLATISNVNLFLPRPGEVWVVNKVWLRLRDKAGPVDTIVGTFSIDNGTDGQNIVTAPGTFATTALSIGTIKEQTVLPDRQLTHLAPLRLKHLIKGTGPTLARFDFIVTLTKLSEIA